MKLAQLFETTDNTPVYAYWEQSNGPQDVSGVTLRHIEPVSRFYTSRIKHAKDEHKQERVNKLTKEFEDQRNQGKEYFEHDLDWWKSQKDYDDGVQGPKGLHKGQIQTQYPNLRIFDSKEAAITAAKKDKAL